MSMIIIIYKCGGLDMLISIPCESKFGTSGDGTLNNVFSVIWYFMSLVVTFLTTLLMNNTPSPVIPT